MFATNLTCYLYAEESAGSVASGQNEEAEDEGEEKTTPTDTPTSQSAFPNTQDLFGGDSSYVVVMCARELILHPSNIHAPCILKYFIAAQSIQCACVFLINPPRFLW